ncbi:MAG: hypothetical protein MZV49_12600 [Rhodopseudomonas palustris]|nr:hypothetical protein [Rhodopseudomonas palustris]
MRSRSASRWRGAALAAGRRRSWTRRATTRAPATTPTRPTAVYKAGSFDLTEFEIKARRQGRLHGRPSTTALEDPWGMGGGFATQMVFIFIDTDDKAGSGYTEGAARA